MSVQIHPTAIIAPGAELDSDVTVGPYSIVGENVRVGARTKIGPHVVLDGHTTLGTDNSISPFASVGGPPQDLKYKGEPSTLVIGSGNTIREYVTLQPGTQHGTMTTTIGDRNLFMAYSHVAHDSRVGDRNIFANSATLAGHVEVGNGVILGGLVAIHQFVRVGDLAFLGGGTMVAKDVPPFAMVQGDRGRLRGLNVVGMRRSGVGASELSVVKAAYRILFWRSGAIEDKLSELPAEMAECAPVKLLIEFCKPSKRGDVQPRHGANAEIDDDAVE